MTTRSKSSIRNSPDALQSRFRGREWQNDQTSIILMERVAEKNNRRLVSKVCKFIDTRRQVVNTILSVENRYVRDSLINMFFKTVGDDLAIHDKDIKDRCVAIVCRKLVQYRNAMTPNKEVGEDIKHTSEMDFE